MYPQPIESETFQWQDLEACGVTSLGAAYAELNEKLSRSHGFMAEPTGSRAPAIILLTDGMPTDEWKHPLAKLKNNPWFKAGVKVAIAIGDETTNVDVLEEFTGDKEAVITVHNVDQLKKIIKTVSVSGSGSSAPADAQSQVVASVTSAIQSDDDLQKVDQGGSTANAGTDDFSNWC